MNKLQKIIAGASMIGALAFGYKNNADAQVLPTKVTTETAIKSNNDVTGIPFQRIELGNDAWTFRYDFNIKQKATDKPRNVGMISLNKVYSKNDFNIGFEVFQVGKFDSLDVYFADAWIDKKIGKVAVMLDIGKGFPIDKAMQDYEIATVKGEKFSLEEAIYSIGPMFKEGVERRTYSLAEYHGNNLFLAAGHKIVQGNNLHLAGGALGITGLKDIGEFTYALYDWKTNDTKIFSVTAIGDVNPKFYTAQTFEKRMENNLMPAYFPLHVTQANDKGTAVLLFKYISNHADDIKTLEVMAATNKTPFVQMGVGLNRERHGNNVAYGAAIEMLKRIELGKFNAIIELRDDIGKNSSTAYGKNCLSAFVTASYTF